MSQNCTVPLPGQVWRVKIWRRTRWAAAMVLVLEEYDVPERGWHLHLAGGGGGSVAITGKQIKFIEREEVQHGSER